MELLSFCAFSVDGTHEARRALLEANIQLDAVGAHVARRIFVDVAVFGRGAALVEESGRAGRAVEKLRLARREDNGLVGVRRGEGDDAHMVEKAVETVRFQQLARQAGVDVLGVVGRFEDERLTVHIAHAREAVDLHVRLKAHERDDPGTRRDDRKIHERGRGRLAELGDLRCERILHALAAGVRVGDERALAALAHDKALLFQRADGLTHGVAADVVGAAKLGLARQQVADLERAGGDAALDDAHELGVEGDLAVERQREIQDRISFHDGSLPRKYVLEYSYCTTSFWDVPELFLLFA